MCTLIHTYPSTPLLNSWVYVCGSFVKGHVCGAEMDKWAWVRDEMGWWRDDGEVTTA